MEPKNYIFEVQQQSKFLFINRRLIRLIFLTKLLKYFQHLFIECGERRDLYHSRPLFNIFVLCPGLLGFSIQRCTYQTCHSRMRGRFVSAMSLYGKVRGINLRAQVFFSWLILANPISQKAKMSCSFIRILKVHIIWELELKMIMSVCVGRTRVYHTSLQLHRDHSFYHCISNANPERPLQGWGGWCTSQITPFQ